jgi:CheY-like chemotaxis protein
MTQPLSPGKTLLVVEDDDIAREGLAVVLGRAGYEVAQAANGQEALDYLRRAPTPAAILLDMLLPQCDGWYFLAQRQQDPTWAAVPVLITTALGVASKDWAESLGAAGYLHKPFDVETLLHEVERCCKEHGETGSHLG